MIFGIFLFAIIFSLNILSLGVGVDKLGIYAKDGKCIFECLAWVALKF